MTEAPTTTVVVTHGHAVHHDGRHHEGGQQVQVPADLAVQWIRTGWARPVPYKAPAKPRRGTSTT